MKNFKAWIVKLNNARFGLVEKVLLLAPIAVWFSYYPNLHIGRSDGTNLEFSISLIYIVILAAVGLTTIWANRHQLIKNRAAIATGVFVFWNFLSIIWGANPVRGFLNSGVWLVLWLCFLTVLSLKNIGRLTPILMQIFIGTATIVSILAILQVIYGTWTDWGLCGGCLARGFGFVRPSVFAVEPQFLGNLLLVPIIILFYKLFRQNIGRVEKFSLLIMLVAMYLTLSRGAIYALVLALGVLSIINVKAYGAKSKKTISSLLYFLAAGFIFGMTFHGVFTELNPRVADGFYDSVTKSINQLSLGVVKLPDMPKGNDRVDVPSDNSGAPPNKALFSGYVEKSTNERSKLNALAVKTWSQNWHTILLGVGAGGSGKAMYDFNRSTGWDMEIVQNEYLSVLLELGLIGAMLFVGLIAGAIYLARREKWLWSILVGFLAQWMFFSGLPNVLHIYLILGVMFSFIMYREKKLA